MLTKYEKEMEKKNEQELEKKRKKDIKLQEAKRRKVIYNHFDYENRSQIDMLKTKLYGQLSNAKVFGPVRLTSNQKCEMLGGFTMEKNETILNTNDNGYIWGQNEVKINHVRPLKHFGSSLTCPAVQREAYNIYNVVLVTADEKAKKGSRFTSNDAIAFKSTANGIAMEELKSKWAIQTPSICNGCEFCPQWFRPVKTI
jgi:hypothetical protein